jgi:predicted nucleotidyltransferase
VKAPLTVKEEIAKAVANYMADQPFVLVAYSLGSVVRGRLTVESDIDIAMLFSRSPNGLSCSICKKS